MKKIFLVFFYIWVVILSLLSILHIEFPYRQVLLWLSIAILSVIEVYFFLIKKKA